MENEENTTGEMDKPLTRKYLVIFPAISAIITIVIILLLLILPGVSTLLKLGKSVTIDDGGNLSFTGAASAVQLGATATNKSSLIVSSTLLIENLNAEFLNGHPASDFLRAAEIVDLELIPNLSSLYLLIEETATNSSKLGGFSYTYYLDASNFTSGTVALALLPDLSSLYLPIEGTAVNSLELAGEGQSFYLNASNLASGTVPLAQLPDLSSLYLSLGGGTLSGALSLSDNAIDSLGSLTFSDGTIQTTAQATAATFVVCASDSNNLGRCDYVADGAGDQVEIQEAVDNLPAAGGKVVLLEGNYYISTPVDLRSNLEISGMQGTKLHLTVRTNFFRWDENAGGVHQTNPDSSLHTVVPLHDIYIHDMELDGNKAAFSPPSGGAASDGTASAIKVFNSSRLHFANLYIHDMEASYAILLKGRVYPWWDSGSTDVFVQKNIFHNIGDTDGNHGAVYSDHDNTVIQSNLVDTVNGSGLNIDVAQEGTIRDNIIKNVITAFEGYAIVTGYNANNITIAGNTITNCSRGIANHIGGTPANDNHVIINNILQDSPGAIDYAIKLGDSGHIVSGNRIRNWGHDAVNLVATKKSIISQNVISGIDRGFGVGINVGSFGAENVEDVIIEDNIIYDTGTTLQKGWGLRILPSGDITGLIIRGNRIFDSGAGVQEYGIFLNSVTATSEIQIEGNYLEGNTSAAIALGGGSVLNSTVKALRNRGFTTENSSTATITNGTTSIAVSHGLSITPSAKDIQVTPTNSLGSATKFWISSVGASTFTINVDLDPGVTTATFSWTAAIY